VCHDLSQQLQRASCSLELCDVAQALSVRAVHRDRADLHKLAEVLIRLTLQETGESRAAREATRVPDTYRAATDGLAASEAAR